MAKAPVRVGGSLWPFAFSAMLYILIVDGTMSFGCEEMIVDFCQKVYQDPFCPMDLEERNDGNEEYPNFGLEVGPIAIDVGDVDQIFGWWKVLRVVAGSVIPQCSIVTDCPVESVVEGWTSVALLVR